MGHDGYFSSVWHAYHLLRFRPCRTKSFHLYQELEEEETVSLIFMIARDIEADCRFTDTAHDRLAIMDRALQAKFFLCPDLRTQLLDTMGKTLLFASTDMFWGIGCQIEDPRCLHYTYWGCNYLGRLLMSIRADLSRERHFLSSSASGKSSIWI